MVIYGAACEECQFTFQNRCDATTHEVAERHARVRSHAVVYGSWTEGDDALSRKASHYTPEAET